MVVQSTSAYSALPSFNATTCRVRTSRLLVSRTRQITRRTYFEDLDHTIGHMVVGKLQDGSFDVTVTESHISEYSAEASLDCRVCVEAETFVVLQLVVHVPDLDHCLWPANLPVIGSTLPNQQLALYSSSLHVAFIHLCGSEYTRQFRQWCS